MKHHAANHDHQEAAALYSLGALSQAEARAFEFHLRDGCEACDSELSAFEQVTANLALASDEITPPPYLRDLLVERVNREPQAEATAHPASPSPRPHLVRTPPRPSRAPWAIAAALAVFAISSLLLMLQGQRQLRQAEKELAASRGEAETLKQPTPAPQVIRLKGQGIAPDSTAEIYWDKTNRKWVMTAKLPPLPAGKVYQVWFVHPEAKVSAGLLKPSETGAAFAVFDVPADLGQLQAAAVTVEPEGGSLQPTLPIYLLGTLS